MREIKFRAWINSLKKYLYIVGFCYEGETSIRLWYFINYPDEPLLVNQSFLRDDVILEQYTGLKVKKVKEIYDGDILQCEGHTYKYVVKWWNDSAGFNLAWVFESIIKGYEIKIIGNINENPELSINRKDKPNE